MKKIEKIFLVIVVIMWIADLVTISNKSFKYPAKLITNIDVDKFYETNKRKVGKK